ncbi:hypothetical protein [Bartonella bovis]|uniref:hypothetical protein n=1 Tax=Bartonella bovis TaxID=155194 RepID=UPI0012601D25|nr:hypothetical protein [Bartonella bovis]
MDTSLLSAPLDVSKFLKDLVESLQQLFNQLQPILYIGTLLFFLALKGVQFFRTVKSLVRQKVDPINFVWEIAKLIFVIGIFVIFLEYSQKWSMAVINTVWEETIQEIGESKNLLAGKLFGETIRLTDIILNEYTLFSLPGAEKSFCVLIILLCFGFVEVLMIFTVITTYIVTNIPILFISVSVFQYIRKTIMAFCCVVFMHTKLFIFTVLVFEITESVVKWQEVYNGSSALIWIMANALTYVIFIKIAPKWVVFMILKSSSGAISTIKEMVYSAETVITEAAADAAAAAARTKNR